MTVSAITRAFAPCRASQPLNRSIILGVHSGATAKPINGTSSRTSMTAFTEHGEDDACAAEIKPADLRQ